MSAAKVHLYCEQGATFLRTVTLEGVDITGYLPRGSLRLLSPNQDEYLDFNCAVLSGSTGVFTFSLTAEQTENLFTTGQQFSQVTRYAYDLEILHADGVTVTRLLNGDFVVSPTNTKDYSQSTTVVGFDGSQLQTFNSDPISLFI